MCVFCVWECVGECICCYCCEGWMEGGEGGGLMHEVPE